MRISLSCLAFRTRDKYEFMAALVPQLNAAVAKWPPKPARRFILWMFFPQLAEGSGEQLAPPRVFQRRTPPEPRRLQNHSRGVCWGAGFGRDSA
jgi:hypothetical protein